MDPGTSAHLIYANELAELDPSNKFATRWADHDHKGGFKTRHVPQHFYKNYKHNLIRDAHSMAKTIQQNRSQSPVQKECGHGNHENNCDLC